MARDQAARVRLGQAEFIKKGARRLDIRDPYHLAVTLTWPHFFAALLALYLSVNFAFAVLYWLVPGAVANARPGDFGDSFFFSIETLATVGYGAMYPATLAGHLISSAEILCGLAFTAVVTGLTFVRFSRRRAKFLFADHPVVTSHNGRPTLMVRIGNGRAAVLSDTVAHLSVLITETTAEGNSFRRAEELTLERGRIPIFPLAWTIMHVIDERSPLHALDEQSIARSNIRLFLTFEARDPVLAVVVHEVRTYEPSDIRFGQRYADAITTREDGKSMIDLAEISTLVPDS